MTLSKKAIDMDKVVRQLLKRLHLAYCSTHDTLFSTGDRPNFDYDCPRRKGDDKCHTVSEYEW